MNDQQRIQLGNMIKENNVVDQTSLIRQLKHSKIMYENINALLDLKVSFSGNELDIKAAEECSFLYTYYTEIYNKIKNDEIDIDILFKFIDKLEDIELEKTDQHEASFEIGTLLKQIYVDSALRKAKKLDQQYEVEKNIPKKENISWTEFKSSLSQCPTRFPRIV
jgi:hypothetical protein